MRSSKIVFMQCIAVLCIGACAGCGDNSGGQAELAKLSTPPGASEEAKAQPPPKAKPKFGSPPRSEMVPRANPGS